MENLFINGLLAKIIQKKTSTKKEGTTFELFIRRLCLFTTLMYRLISLFIFLIAEFPEKHHQHSLYICLPI